MIKSALRRCKCLGSLNSAENVGNGGRTFGKFTRNSLVACSSLEVTYKGLGRIFARGRKHTHKTQFFLPPSECHTRCSETEVHGFGVSCWLTWASECKRPLGRPFVLFLQESTGYQWEGVPSWRLRSRAKTFQCTFWCCKAKKGCVLLRLSRSTFLVVYVLSQRKCVSWGDQGHFFGSVCM